MDATESMSTAELVTRCKSAYGLSWKTLGEAFGRSERMMRKIANGETSGESFRPALRQLYSTGQVTSGVPRRRDKSGKMVKVRSSSKSGTKSAAPKFDTRGTPAPKQGRNMFKAKMTYLPGNNRSAVVNMPKSKYSPNRGKGWEAVKGSLTSLSRSQHHTDKRIKPRILVESSDGKDRKWVQLGDKSGYHLSDAVKDVRTRHGGSWESWTQDQLNKVSQAPAGSSAPESMAGYSVVGFNYQSHDAQRSKAERQAQDAAGTRRRGRRR